MFTVQNYIKPKSLEEAYALLQKRGNRVVGGMQWMKMSSAACAAVIDLSELGLSGIKDTGGAFSIGCMTTLRELEQNPAMSAFSQGAVKEALRGIVGVQFRNLATIGGTVAGRYGFSDVLTILSVMDTQVELFKAGLVPLASYLASAPDRDIVVRLIIEKNPATFTYLSVRRTRTDLPSLTCASCVTQGSGALLRIAVGARPGAARCIELPLNEERSSELYHGKTERLEEDAVCFARKEIALSGNLRGSAQYREHLLEVLVRRSIRQQLEKLTETATDHENRAVRERTQEV